LSQPRKHQGFTILSQVSWLLPDWYVYPDFVRLLTQQVKVPPCWFTGEFKTTCPLVPVVPEPVPETQPDHVIFTVAPESTA
jgi:hypothetical protein